MVLDGMHRRRANACAGQRCAQVVGDVGALAALLRSRSSTSAGLTPEVST